jgi:acyl transferase domain-containing protein
VGHLDAAAGIAGLIRTVMALRARELPPTLHYQAPNPALELSASPCFVSDEPRPWEPRSAVRRAGVSSFGVGGTNAHVVLQEAPDAPAPGGEWQALVLSARKPEALDQAAERLAAHLRTHPEQALADVAWTLAAGRREMEHRRVVVCRTHAEGAALLDAPAAAASPADGAPPVAFLFPGQGAVRRDGACVVRRGARLPGGGGPLRRASPAAPGAGPAHPAAPRAGGGGRGQRAAGGDVADDLCSELPSGPERIVLLLPGQRHALA